MDFIIAGIELNLAHNAHVIRGSETQCIIISQGDLSEVAPNKTYLPIIYKFCESV